MTNLIADEKEINLLAEIMVDLNSKIEKMIKLMTDKNEDIFNRYMGYVTLKALCTSVKGAEQVIKLCTVSGHTLHDEILHSGAHKEAQWGVLRTEKHPFFCTKENCETEKNEYKSPGIERFIECINNFFDKQFKKG